MRLLKRLAQGLGLLLVLVLLTAAGAGIWIHGRLRASLPELDGERTVADLRSPVTIERDALGIPTIRAANRVDLARATGWIHAQDRFFQMDLLRRKAAGELAALFGQAVVAIDRENRLHRFRARAGRAWELASPDAREILDAYAAGVNAGLDALGAPPPEYLLLRTAPEPWTARDSLLVLYAMYLDLQGGNGVRESRLGELRDRLPAELFDFLFPRSTEWDAPLGGEPGPEPPLPGPDVIDLREASPDRSAGLGMVPTAALEPAILPGSNNWAVTGSRTDDGGAWIANDMHLPLMLPNIWYRACLVWPDPDRPGTDRRVAGVTLPGTPALVAGSNGHVAWGFTNAYGDWIDLVDLELDRPGGERYRTPDGWRDFERHEETIAVRGGEPETLVVRETIWGPVVDAGPPGARRAIRWVAHDPEAANFRLLELERADDVDAALAIARRAGIPAQNVVLAGANGRIAWTIMGMMPRRFGHDGLVPVSWADGTRGWNGWLDPSEYPVVADPASEAIWTANNRVLEDAGPRDMPLGARARQIRDALLTMRGGGADDLLAVQLDDRAVFLERWHRLLLDALTPAATEGHPRRAELRRVLEETWTGRASIDSAAYRFARAFRLTLGEQVLDALCAPWRRDGDEIHVTQVSFQWEAPLWRLVRDRPAHLLPPGHATWDDQILAAADASVDAVVAGREDPLAERTWGERNTVKIGHPLARAVPKLSGWLDLAPVELPGDSNMPRVQSPGFGASERFAVSPGREEDGYLHMPGGQSGHPLSPFYREGNAAWVRGEPTPFLPGPGRHTLTLVPLNAPDRSRPESPARSRRTGRSTGPDRG